MLRNDVRPICHAAASGNMPGLVIENRHRDGRVVLIPTLDDRSPFARLWLLLEMRIALAVLGMSMYFDCQPSFSCLVRLR